MTVPISTNAEMEAHMVPGQGAQPRRCVMQVTWSLVAGGAETYALTVAAGLNVRRYRAVMCGVDKGGELEAEIQRRRIPYCIMHRRDGLDFWLMWRMYRLLRRERVDVIHTHHFNQLFYSVLPAKLLGIRVVHTEHSSEMCKRRRIRWALRMMALLCHRVTAIGADVERTLKDKVGIAARRLVVIRAAVDLERFRLDHSDARRTLCLAENDRVVVIVARLYPEKRHELLLRAMGDVLRRVPEAKLLVAGDGVERERIQRQSEELGLCGSVMMLGARLDVPVLLAAADVFVLCSEREGLPIAVLEAMAASLPVVATPVGDVPLVVHDRETGLLVESGNSRALADALAELLGNLPYARELGAAGRALVQKEFSLERMVREHERLYG